MYNCSARRRPAVPIAAARCGPRGQQQIDTARAREIQNALIREHYLDGEASGQWDQRTKDAMTRYQADHGWQTRVRQTRDSKSAPRRRSW